METKINGDLAIKDGAVANNAVTSEAGEKIDVKISYTSDLIQKMSKTTGISLLECIIELIDNGMEATDNVGTVKVITNPLWLENGCMLCVCDNGHGMDVDDVKNLFFKIGAGNTEKTGIHARMGGRISMTKLCLTNVDNTSKVVIYTKKENSRGIKIEWDGRSNEPDVRYCDSYVVDGKDIPLTTGTKMFFYEINLGYKISDNDAVEKFSKELEQTCNVRYFPAIREGFEVIVNHKKILDEHPLYDTFISDLSKITKKEVTMIGPLDGKEYIVTYYMRDLSYFCEKVGDKFELRNGFNEDILHNWDRDENNQCRIKEDKTSGVYLKVGKLIISAGGTVWPYINRKMHNSMNGKRILIDIPVELAKQLNFQVNKSKGFVDFEKLFATRNLRDQMLKDFEALIQNSVNNAGSKVSNYTKEFTSDSGKTFTFKSIDNSQKIPGFAMKKDNEMTINTAGEIFSNFKSKTSFTAAFDLSTVIYEAFVNALNAAEKYMPSYNIGAHARSTATNARNETLDFIKEKFDENFMKIEFAKAKRKR